MIEYRDLHFPAPVEMLAEAALLQACAQAGGPFAQRPEVFSNVLLTGDSRAGMVAPYFAWWRLRQQGIRRAASAGGDRAVVYFDIKRFYPSVSPELALLSWRAAADSSRLHPKWIRLGEKLLSDYRRAPHGQGALLMGPVFAHVMGNQVLRQFDDKLSAYAPASYFRYVDDIAIVIPKRERSAATAWIKQNLPEGLELNEDKTLVMSASEWMYRSASFADGVGTSYWQRVVAALKYFLVAHPEHTLQLASVLKEEGFRFPLASHAKAVRERGFVQRLLSRIAEPWFDRALQPSTVKAVLVLAREARRELRTRFDRTLDEGLVAGGLRRKLEVQRIRYTASRLLYLATPQELPHIRDKIEPVRELTELAAIFRGVIEEDVSALLPFSGSVAQAAAQVLIAHGRPVKNRTDGWGAEQEFAWAVLKASGVSFAGAATSPPMTSSLVRFALGMRSNEGVPSDDYYKEVFALSNAAAMLPADLISEAFDTEETATLDALHLLRSSS